MPKTIIADTSCLIILSKIDELDILHKLYGEIVTTVTIAIEYGMPLPDWIEVVNVLNKNSQSILELQLDPGESSAIALAMEIENAILILDDNKARKLADKLGLNYTGTLGIILAAKQKNIITSIKPILEKMKRTNFRISETIVSKLLLLADEENTK